MATTSEWQVEVQHVDTDGVFTVLAASKAEAMMAALDVATVRFGAGCVLSGWVAQP